MLLIATTRIIILTSAQPHSFVLDLGNIDDEITKTTIALPCSTFSPLLEKTTPCALTTTDEYKPTLTTTTTTTTSATNNTSISCPPSPTLLTLYSTVPTDDAHNEGTASTPTGTSLSSLPMTKLWPWWTTPATFALIFYDLFTLAVFLWLWIGGYLSWFQHRRSRSVSVGNSVGEMIHLPLWRADMSEGVPSWESSTGVGFGGDESQEQRRGEIEGEMRRLGMI